MLTQARKKRWQLGQWQLDAPCHQLIKDGERISITAKMQDVLLVLIEAKGRPASRETIYQTVWPDSVVSEQLIARAISDLRKVFGDDAKNPQFIETLPKAGYRFLLPVSEIPQNSVEADVMPQKSVKKSQFGIVVGLCLMMVAVAIVLFTNVKPSKDDEEITASSTELGPAVPLSSQSGIENAPTLSPDGKTLAYTYSAPGSGATHIVLLDTMSNQQKATIESKNKRNISYFAPRFSPDGKQLAFTRYDKDKSNCHVYLTELANLSALKPLALCSGRFMMSVDFSADGQTLYFTQDIDNQRRGLVAINIKTGQKVILTEPTNQGVTDYSPRISPDGRYLLFARGQLKPRHHSALYMLSLDNLKAAPKLLTEVSPAINIYGLSWLNNREVVYVLAAENGQTLRQLNIVDGSDVALEQGNYHRIDYHRPSKTLLYASTRQTSNIARLSLDKPDALEVFLASTRKDHQPKVSPDGKTIAFVADRSGSDQLWLANIDGSGQQQITQLQPMAINTISWSLDGKELLLALQSDRQSSIYRFSLHNKTMARVEVEGSNVADARFSAHPQWLVAGCRDGSQWQICRIPITGGKPTLMTDNGGVVPFTPHHSDFVYFTRQGQGLWRMPMFGGVPEMVWREFPEHSWKNWLLFENQLYFLLHDNVTSRAQLIRRDLISSENQVLFEGDLSWNETSFAISPAGRTLYLSVKTQGSDDIYRRQLK